MIQNDVAVVEGTIRTLIKKFQKNPEYFFSEYDLRSYLYHLLVTEPSFSQERFTKDGVLIGTIHAEHTVIGGRLDIAVLDPQSVDRLAKNEQAILCGIEIGLNRSYAHFEKDYSFKFVKEAENRLLYGYVLHFVEGEHKDWRGVPDNVMEAARTGDCTIIDILDEDKVKAVAVRIQV